MRISNQGKNIRVIITSLFVIIFMLNNSSAAAESAGVDTAGVPGGVCLILDGKADEVSGVVTAGPFLVHTLHKDETQAIAMRDAQAAAGLSSFVVSERWLEFPDLPYTKNHITLLIANNYPKFRDQGLKLEQIVRSLVPFGKASLRGIAESDRADYEATLKKCGVDTCAWSDDQVTFQKPWQAGMGVWTHGQQGPDGKPVADDTYMAVPNQIQWITGNGDKELGSLTQTRVAGGRAFYFYKTAIVARDAGSGVLLWVRPIGRPGGSVLTEDGDIITRDPDDAGWTPKVALLSGATGKTIRKFGKSGFPGPYEDGLVLAGNAYGVVAHDVKTGEKLWSQQYKSKKAKPSFADFKNRRGIAPQAARLMANGFVFTRYDPGVLVARNARSGDVVWKKNVAEALGGDFAMHFIDDDKIIVRVEIKDKYLGKVGGGMVSVEEAYTGTIRFAAISTKDGAMIWKHDWSTVLAPSYRGHVYKAAGLIWLCRHEELMPETLTLTDNPESNKKIIGRYMNDPNPSVFEGLNPDTGAIEKSLTMPKQIHYHCYQLTVTDRYYTGNRPYYFVNWKTGKLEGRFGAVRSPCDGVGHFAAQGLWFARGSYGCGCIRTVMQAMGTYSASDEPSWDGAVEESKHPLVKGAVDLPSAESLATGDWPMYRGDHARSATSTASITDELAVSWRYQPGDNNKLSKSAIRYDWSRNNFLASNKVSQPTIANGRVFVSLLETKQVVAINGDTGTVIWSKNLPAMVDTSPTIYKGLALVGCHDGWVYALRADNGEEVWRLRIAPAERRVVAYGQLESSWPVIGGVIVVNDTAYAIAGRTTEVDGGLYVLAFEATSGRVLWEGRRYLNNPGDVGPADSERHQNSVTGASDLLISDGKSISVGNKVKGARSCFDAITGEDVGSKTRRYAAKSFGTNRLSVKSFFGLCFDGNQVYSAKKPEKKLNRKKEVVSTKPGYIAKEKSWKISTETAESKAIVVAGERIYAAVSGSDKNELWVLSKQDGKLIKALPLAAAPVADGIALANDMVLVALEDGSVMCFAGK